MTYWPGDDVDVIATAPDWVRGRVKEAAGRPGAFQARIATRPKNSDDPPK